jgi:hypothetical protein
MKAIISSTYDDMYLFFLPLVAWSWRKIGVEVFCFIPGDLSEFSHYSKFATVLQALKEQCMQYDFSMINAPNIKEATYAQCSRLYASAIPELDENEVLITGDVDMAVFGDYLLQANSGQIHVFGTDLVPPNQYPICYIAMPVKTWREVMWITSGVPVQQYLDELLGHLECDHFRGNYWGKDQETIYNQLERGCWPIVKHERAKAPHQFATRRADRDSWPDIPLPDTIDAHLPRPGYTDQNWSKIFNLFKTMYPNEDLQWMEVYRNQYIKLL